MLTKLFILKKSKLIDFSAVLEKELVKTLVCREKKHLVKELEDCKTKCEDLRKQKCEAVRELLTMQEARHAG